MEINCPELLASLTQLGLKHVNQTLHVSTVLACSKLPSIAQRQLALAPSMVWVYCIDQTAILVDSPRMDT